MKAVIVEIRGKYAVVLNKQGQFTKIKNNHSYKVGAEIDVRQGLNISPGTLARVASIAAAFILTAGLGYGVYSYNKPYSYITVDINPSIELTANRYDMITGVRALNEDGKRILENKSFKFKSIEAGVEAILEGALEEGYISEEYENAVMFTVASADEDKIEEIEKDVEDTARHELDTAVDNAEIMVEKADDKIREEAKKSGISPGKLLLIEKLKTADPEIDADTYRNASVRDIVKKIKESKNKNKENNGKGQIKDPLSETPQESTGKPDDKKDNGNNGKGNSKTDSNNGSKNGKGLGLIKNGKAQTSSSESGSKDQGSSKTTGNGKVKTKGNSKKHSSNYSLNSGQVEGDTDSPVEGDGNSPDYTYIPADDEEDYKVTGKDKVKDKGNNGNGWGSNKNR